MQTLDDNEIELPFTSEGMYTSGDNKGFLDSISDEQVLVMLKIISTPEFIAALESKWKLNL